MQWFETCEVVGSGWWWKGGGRGAVRSSSCTACTTPCTREQTKENSAVKRLPLQTAQAVRTLISSRCRGVYSAFILSESISVRAVSANSKSMVGVHSQPEWAGGAAGACQTGLQ